MTRSFEVGTPGMRLARRLERGDVVGADDAIDAGGCGGSDGSDTAAMASSSVSRSVSFTTTERRLAARRETRLVHSGLQIHQEA